MSSRVIASTAVAFIARHIVRAKFKFELDHNGARNVKPARRERSGRRLEAENKVSPPQERKEVSEHAVTHDERCTKMRQERGRLSSKTPRPSAKLNSNGSCLKRL